MPVSPWSTKRIAQTIAAVNFLQSDVKGTLTNGIVAFMAQEIRG